MSPRKILPGLALAAAMLALAFSASAAMGQKFDLGGLVGNADKVFRGTVISKEPGMVRAGGGDLPTVIYTLRVEDPIKGNFGAGKAGQVITIETLGNLKAAPANGPYERLSGFDAYLDLSVGSDYVLFTTRPSRIGLSTTVGLNQGLFRVFANAQGREMTANGVDNSGLFDGAVEYTELVNAIKANIQ